VNIVSAQWRALIGVKKAPSLLQHDRMSDVCQVPLSAVSRCSKFQLYSMTS